MTGKGDQSVTLLDRRTVSSMSYISLHKLIIKYGLARGSIQHEELGK